MRIVVAVAVLYLFLDIAGTSTLLRFQEGQWVDDSACGSTESCEHTFGGTAEFMLTVLPGERTAFYVLDKEMFIDGECGLTTCDSEYNFYEAVNLGDITLLSVSSGLAYITKNSYNNDTISITVEGNNVIFNHDIIYGKWDAVYGLTNQTEEDLLIEPYPYEPCGVLCGGNATCCPFGLVNDGNWCLAADTTEPRAKVSMMIDMTIEQCEGISTSSTTEEETPTTEMSEATSSSSSSTSSSSSGESPQCQIHRQECYASCGGADKSSFTCFTMGGITNSSCNCITASEDEDTEEENQKSVAVEAGLSGIVTVYCIIAAL